MHAWGRALEGQLDAIYRADGTVNAVGLTVRNVHQRKLTETRLSLLTKLSALSGMLECDEVAEALVRVPIPEFADWCAITFIEGQNGRTFLAHCDPSKAPLRDALMRDPPTWDQHPLWQGMLTTGFQLLTEVNDDLLRRLASSETQYRLLRGWGSLADCRPAGVARTDRRHHDLPIRPTPVVATDATIRRWPRRSRCTPPTGSRTRG